VYETQKHKLQDTTKLIVQELWKWSKSGKHRNLR